MSCLFDSLSAFTPNFSSRELRLRIVEYLKTNPRNMMDDVETTFADIMAWMQEDVDKYCESMSNDATWGGAIEIRAFVNLFRTNVTVHTTHPQAPKRTIEFKCSVSTPNAVNILWTGNHFVPLQRPA